MRVPGLIPRLAGGASPVRPRHGLAPGRRRGPTDPGADHGRTGRGGNPGANGVHPPRSGRGHPLGGRGRGRRLMTPYLGVPRVVSRCGRSSATNCGPFSAWLAMTRLTRADYACAQGQGGTSRPTGDGAGGRSRVADTGGSGLALCGGSRPKPLMGV